MLPRLLSNLVPCKLNPIKSSGQRFSSRIFSPGFRSDSLSIKEVKLGDTVHDDEKILMPYNHLSDVVGKNSRMKMIEAYNYWLKVPQDVVDKVEEVSKIIHNYDMLIDDLEDNTAVRRNVPVAQEIFGYPFTLASASYSVFLGLQKCENIHPKATQIYVEQILELLRGQAIEVYWRESGIVPTEDEWIKSTVQRNAGMVMIPYRLMQLFSDNKTDYNSFFPDYTLLCQIKDDYSEFVLQNPEDYTDKCNDITEGQYGFPIMHALHQSDGEKLLALLRQRSNDVEMKKYAMSIIQKHGSLDYCLKIIEVLLLRLKKRLAEFGGNPLMEEFLDEYYAYVLKPNAQKNFLNKK